MVKSLLSDVDIPDVSLAEFILARAKKHGDRIALISSETGFQLTYRQLCDMANLVAVGLQRRGLKKGDIVGLCLDNCPEYAAIVLGVLQAGGTVCTFSNHYTVYEMSVQLDDCRPSHFISGGSCQTVVEEAIKKTHIETQLISMQHSASASSTLQDLLETGKGAVLQPNIANPKEDVAFICCSSGTTGKPKGVMLTHRNIVANICQASHPLLDTHGVYQQAPGVADVTLAFLPFYHSYGLFAVLCRVLSYGNTMVTMRKFAPKLFLSSIQNYKVTSISLVPPVLLFLASSPLVANYDLSSIRRVCSAAASIGCDVIAEVKRRLGITTIQQAYGLTETSPGLTKALPNQKPGSSGVLLPNTEMKIVDLDTGIEQSVGQRGEIVVRGPQVMKGYLHNPEATKNVLDPDGWFRTGDVGYLDEIGNLFVVDRIKELIKYKGHQVAPAELEAVLLTHAQIADAAVIGVPDHVAGEVPKAYVVRKSGANINEDDIKAHMGEKLNSTKQLRGGIEFVRAIPKSPSGKILRNELRQRAKKQLSKL